MIHQGYSTKDRIGVELYIKMCQKKQSIFHSIVHVKIIIIHTPIFPAEQASRFLIMTMIPPYARSSTSFFLAFFLEGILFIGTGLLKTSACPKDTSLLSSTFSTIA